MSLQQWEKFCHSVEIANWTRSDTKDNITISRCRFGRSSKGFAVIKLEGILKSDPRNVFNFLQLSTKQGGKVNINDNHFFIFLSGQFSWTIFSGMNTFCKKSQVCYPTVHVRVLHHSFLLFTCSGEPKATVIYNIFQPPLPQLSIRDVVAMKVWVPSAMSYSNKFGT